MRASTYFDPVLEVGLHPADDELGALGEVVVGLDVGRDPPVEGDHQNLLLILAGVTLQVTTLAMMGTPLSVSQLPQE